MNAETLEKMKSMKFNGMARAFSSCLEDGQLTKMTRFIMIYSRILFRLGAAAMIS